MSTRARRRLGGRRPTTSTDASGPDRGPTGASTPPAPPTAGTARPPIAEPVRPVRTEATETSRQPVASLRGVGKRFGSIQALHELDIEIARSRITVLLGPNGAGKTTAIRLITGALGPDEGHVSVFGDDPTGPGGEEIRRRCGIVSAKPSLYDRLSGRDNLRYAAELYGLGRGPAVEARIEESAAWFGIEPALEQLVGGYSTGMKTRLALARAILHDPDLLLLDEPTSGLDPESARSVLRLVREMTARGRSVLLCTHLLAEAEGLADDIVVVHDGTTVVQGRPEQLALRYWPRPQVTFRAADGRDLRGLADHPGVLDAEPVDEGVRVTVPDEETATTVTRWLVQSGVPLRAVVPWEPSLEDLYFAIRLDHGLEQRVAPATGGPTDADGGEPSPTKGAATWV